VHFTLCDYVVEIVQNAVESGATAIRVSCEESADVCRFVVEDNGCGMTKEQLAACRSPFVTSAGKHPHRKVGLGIPFLIQCAETVGGQCRLDSEPGRGTRVDVEFPLGHLDTPPRGELEDLWMSILRFDGDFDFIIERTKRTDAAGEAQGYRLDRRELGAILGDLREVGAQSAFRQFVREQEAAMRSSCATANH
jgi:hypothetical protein